MMPSQTVPQAREVATAGPRLRGGVPLPSEKPLPEEAIIKAQEALDAPLNDQHYNRAVWMLAAIATVYPGLYEGRELQRAKILELGGRDYDLVRNFLKEVTRTERIWNIDQAGDGPMQQGSVPTIVKPFEQVLPKFTAQQESTKPAMVFSICGFSLGDAKNRYDEFGLICDVLPVGGRGILRPFGQNYVFGDSTEEELDKLTSFLAEHGIAVEAIFLIPDEQIHDRRILVLRRTTPSS